MLVAKWNTSYHRERQLASDLIVVVVSLFDLWLAGGKMRAHKANTGGVEEHTNSHTPLVTRRTTHPGLDCVYRNISVQKWK